MTSKGLLRRVIQLSVVLAVLFSMALEKKGNPKFAEISLGANVARGIAGDSPIVPPVLTLDQINQLGSKANTVDDFIQSLPTEITSQYVMMYESKSLQKASPKKPRVILHGKDAKIIFSFAGKPEKSKAEEVVELIRFDDQAKQFDFYELTFNGSSGGVLSERNPIRCLECHRSKDPRPNWEPYNRWPGSFGSKGDIPTQIETQYLKEFFSDPSREKRYQALDPTYFEISKKADLFKQHRFVSTPNVSFTLMLSQLNVARVAQMIRLTPDYDRLKFAIMGQLLCDSAVQFFPEKISQEWIALKKEVFTESETLSEASVEELKAYVRPLRYLFESRGVFMQDWFMNFEIDSSNTFASPFRAELELAAAMVTGDPEFKSVVETKIYPFHMDLLSVNTDKRTEICEKLQVENLKRLEKYSVPKLQDWIQGEAALRLKQVVGIGEPLKICSTCHQNFGGGGLTANLTDIWFPEHPGQYASWIDTMKRNPQWIKSMRERLDLRASEKTRMPPRRKLSVKERESVFKFLDLIEGIHR